MLFSLIRSNFSISSAVACIISSLVVIFLTLPIHEYAHGLVASKLGDPTPRYQGRLTLNPFAHIDYIGALSILLFGFGWAKPVQINARYFKNPKAGMALSALAGPTSNILVAIIAIMFSNVIKYFFTSAISGDTAITVIFILYAIFYYIAQINVYLAVFNLLPVPPLDGSRILFAFLPTKYYFGFMKYERYITIGIFVLLWTGVLSVPLNYLSGAVMHFVYLIADLPFKFFV